LITFPVIMQLLRAVGREDAEPLQLAIHPLADHFPNLAIWMSRIESLPGYDNAYPPHWK
jgi:glutathione S-transferase